MGLGQRVGRRGRGPGPRGGRRVLGLGQRVGRGLRGGGGFSGRLAGDEEKKERGEVADFHSGAMDKCSR